MLSAVLTEERQNIKNKYRAKLLVCGCVTDFISAHKDQTNYTRVHHILDLPTFVTGLDFLWFLAALTLVSHLEADNKWLTHVGFTQ
jgi:hypothetical protein